MRNYDPRNAAVLAVLETDQQQRMDAVARGQGGARADGVAGGGSRGAAGGGGVAGGAAGEVERIDANGLRVINRAALDPRIRMRNVLDCAARWEYSGPKFLMKTKVFSGPKFLVLCQILMSSLQNFGIYQEAQILFRSCWVQSAV